MRKIDGGRKKKSAIVKRERERPTPQGRKKNSPTISLLPFFKTSFSFQRPVKSPFCSPPRIPNRNSILGKGRGLAGKKRGEGEEEEEQGEEGSLSLPFSPKRLAAHSLLLFSPPLGSFLTCKKKKNGIRRRLPRAPRRAHHHGLRAPPRLRGRRPRVGLRARGQARRPRRWPGR